MSLLEAEILKNSKKYKTPMHSMHLLHNMLNAKIKIPENSFAKYRLIEELAKDSRNQFGNEHKQQKLHLEQLLSDYGEEVSLLQ